MKKQTSNLSVKELKKLLDKKQNQVKEETDKIIKKIITKDLIKEAKKAFDVEVARVTLNDGTLEIYFDIPITVCDADGIGRAYADLDNVNDMSSNSKVLNKFLEHMEWTNVSLDFVKKSATVKNTIKEKQNLINSVAKKIKLLAKNNGIDYDDLFSEIEEHLNYWI